jgi:hypothetical protein
MLSSNRRFFDQTVKTVPIEKLVRYIYHFPEEEIYCTIISSMIAAAIISQFSKDVGMGTLGTLK